MAADYLLEKLLSDYPMFKKIKRSTKLVGREQELRMLEESLYKKRMRNSILVGNAGVGKTAIIEELAYKIRDRFIVLEMNIPGAVAGTTYRGDFEKKIDDALKAIIKYNENTAKGHDKTIIIFIDEIHTIYDAGASEGGISAGNMLKPYLSKGIITMIGATTMAEYNDTIKRDSALSRRLPPIFVEALGDKDNLKILKDFSEGTINDKGIEYIYRISQTIEHTQNPDISLEIVDRCMARKKMSGEDITSDTVDDIVEYIRKGFNYEQKF